MSSKFTDSQPTIELKVNSPTANVGITDAEYNIRLNPDVEADIFATKTELSAVENKIPAEYVKSAAVADNKLTLTKQDNTVVEFEGGGSYTLPVASTTTLGGVKVDDDVIRINENGTLYMDKTKISASNGLPSGGWYPQILMKNSNNNYDSTWSNISDVLAMAGISIGGSGSDWQVTTSTSESNLYNAKEVVIFWQDSNYNKHQTYLNVGCDYYGNSGTSWGNSNWINTEIRLDSVDSSYNGSSITYDGSNINTINCTINAICYKT